VKKLTRVFVLIGLTLSTGIVLAGTLTTRSITHAGVARSYLEYQPTSVASGPLPLVLVLHGGTESAATAAGSTRATNRWRALSDIEGFVVLYGDATGGQWNDCGQITLSGAAASTADDVGYLRAIAADASRRFSIDQSRIYLNGVSNGGLMTLRGLQEASETFAGGAAFISLNALDSASECKHPINTSTVYYQYGTNDPLIQAAGGVRNQSAVQTLNYWRTRLNCTAPIIDDFADIDTSDNSTISAERFQSCADDSSLHVLTATGAGHTTPSLAYPTAGAQNRDIESVDEAWKILREARLGVDRWFIAGFE
jgi:polyhydroxybutyrate depolymerase